MLSKRLEDKLHQRIRGAGSHKVDAPDFQFDLGDPSLFLPLAKSPTPAPDPSASDDSNDYAIQTASETEESPEPKAPSPPVPTPPQARRTSPRQIQTAPTATTTAATASTRSSDASISMGPPASKLNSEREQKLRQRMRGAASHKVATPVSGFNLDGFLLQTPGGETPSKPPVVEKETTPVQEQPSSSQRRSSRLSGSGLSSGDTGKQGAVAAVTPVARGKRTRQPSPKAITTPREEDKALLLAKRRKVDADTMRQVLMDQAEDVAEGEAEEYDDTPRRLREVQEQGQLSSSPSTRVLNRRKARSQERALAEESEIIELSDDSPAPLGDVSMGGVEEDINADSTILEQTTTTIGPGNTSAVIDLTGAIDESTVLDDVPTGRIPDLSDILVDESTVLQPPESESGETSGETSVLSEIREPNKTVPKQPPAPREKAADKPLPKGPSARRKALAASSSTAATSEPKPAPTTKPAKPAPKKNPTDTTDTPPATTTAAPKKKRKAHTRGEPVPVTVRQLPGSKSIPNAADVLSTFIDEIQSQTKHKRDKVENAAVEEYTRELQSRLLQISDLMTLQARQVQTYKALQKENRENLSTLLGLREQRERIRAEMEEIREVHEKAEREEEENRKIVQVWENVEQLFEKNKGRDMSGEVSGNVETELKLVTGSLGEHEKLLDWKRWAESIVKS